MQPKVSQLQLDDYLRVLQCCQVCVYGAVSVSKTRHSRHFCQSLEALSSKNELLSGLSEDISKFYIATLFKVALVSWRTRIALAAAAAAAYLTCVCSAVCQWDVSCLRDDENWLIVGHDQPCVTHLPSK